MDIDRGPPYIRPTCYPAVSGGESVIRLSLGKLLLVNLLHVVKRTRLIPVIIVVTYVDHVMILILFYFILFFI